MDPPAADAWRCCCTRHVAMPLPVLVLVDALMDIQSQRAGGSGTGVAADAGGTVHGVIGGGITTFAELATICSAPSGNDLKMKAAPSKNDNRSASRSREQISVRTGSAVHGTSHEN
jgi:hypothetical protein